MQDPKKENKQGYSHAYDVLAAISEVADKEEQKKKSQVNKLIDEVVANLSTHILAKCSMESGMSKFSSSTEEEHCRINLSSTNANFPTFVLGFELIQEGIKKANLDLQYGYTELAFKKDITRKIADLLVRAYEGEYKFGIPRTEEPRKITMPEIAGCMSLVEKELDISHRQVLHTDIVHYVEENVGAERDIYGNKNGRPRYIL